MVHNLTQIEDDAYIPPELIGAKGVTLEQFEELCRKHRKLRLELTSTGELIAMPPTGAETARLNSNLTYQLEAWF
jgi:Uma2 family endonuclease